MRYHWVRMSNPPKETVWIKLPTQNVFQKWSPFSENPLINSILTKVFLLLLNSRRKALMVNAYTNRSMRKQFFMAYNNYNFFNLMKTTIFMCNKIETSYWTLFKKSKICDHCNVYFNIIKIETKHLISIRETISYF